MLAIAEENVNWPEPQCLVAVENLNENLIMIVNESTAKALSKIKDPVVVVSIVGMYRTGKSYLMNKLAGVTKTENSLTEVTKGEGAITSLPFHCRIESNLYILIDK